MSPAVNSAVLGRADEHTVLSDSFPHVNFIYRLYILSFFLLKLHKAAFCLSFKALALFKDDKDVMIYLEGHGGDFIASHLIIAC